MTAQNRSQGFTLIELSVAILIMSVLTIQVFSLFSKQHETFVNHEDTVEAQEDSRLVAGFMLADLRMSGYMVPRVAGVASMDGGNANPDMVCVSDRSIINDDTLVDADGHFDRASLMNDVDAGETVVKLSAGHLDIDDDGDVDFEKERGVIIGDGTASHCALVTLVNTADNEISFKPPTPAGFSASVPAVRVVPARIYRIDGNGLVRDDSTLSTLVEDLQVEFGVDANDNGQLDGGEFPIHDLNGFDASLVRSVRLTLISRTPTEDPELPTAGRPAAGNRVGGEADGFRRRSVIATAFPRNLQ
jgi:prepilin-type N-terminal cleavage/methylation domain-containing protein